MATTARLLYSLSVQLGILVSFIKCECIPYRFDNGHDCKIALQSVCPAGCTGEFR